MRESENERMARIVAPLIRTPEDLAAWKIAEYEAATGDAATEEDYADALAEAREEWTRDRTASRKHTCDGYDSGRDCPACRPDLHPDAPPSQEPREMCPDPYHTRPLDPPGVAYLCPSCNGGARHASTPEERGPERTVGCETDDGLIITHPEHLYCEVCRAAPAPPQEGEGLQEAVHAEMIAYAEAYHRWKTSQGASDWGEYVARVQALYAEALAALRRERDEARAAHARDRSYWIAARRETLEERNHAEAELRQGERTLARVQARLFPDETCVAVPEERLIAALDAVLAEAVAARAEVEEMREGMDYLRGQHARLEEEVEQLRREREILRQAAIRARAAASPTPEAP